MPHYDGIFSHVHRHHVGAKSRLTTERLKNKLSDRAVDICLATARDQLVAEHRHRTAGSTSQFGEEFAPTTHGQAIQLFLLRKPVQPAVVHSVFLTVSIFRVGHITEGPNPPVRRMLITLDCEKHPIHGFKIETFHHFIGVHFCRGK